MTSKKLTCLVSEGSVALLTADEETTEEVRCGYCEKPLPEKHYVNPNGYKYCNKSCYTMFTED